LDKAGQALWRDVHREYVIADVQGLELLCLACEQLDNAAAMQTQIDAEGLTVRTQTGIRDHPLLRHLIASRSFVAKALTKLGIDPAPQRGPGRPPGRGAA
jgi:hypothetical protein